MIDGWVKDVVAVDLADAVVIDLTAKRMTLDGVRLSHTVSPNGSSGYPQDFTIDGTQILVQRSSSIGDNTYTFGTLKLVIDPNVVLYSKRLGRAQPDGTAHAVGHIRELSPAPCGDQRAESLHVRQCAGRSAVRIEQDDRARVALTHPAHDIVDARALGDSQRRGADQIVSHEQGRRNARLKRVPRPDDPNEPLPGVDNGQKPWLRAGNVREERGSHVVVYARQRRRAESPRGRATLE